MFNSVNPKQSFPEMEKSIIDYWKENQTFEKSTKGDKDYVFYDGPPFATGLPHYGHLLAGTLKDVVPRFWTMRGYRIERKWGWDCHGLPIENLVEKELGLKTKTDIENYGVDKFNEYCRSIVLKYAEEWKKRVERMGRWVDMENDYKTMDPEYMESIWWVFKTLWDKGLIYEGHKVVPYCIRCATPLSNFETNQGYQDKQDPALTVKFELVDEPGTYLLAWTTTPWTLPSNLAIAVGPELTYAKIKDKNGDIYIIGLDRIPHFYKNPEDYEILDEFLGKTLEGKKYKPLTEYYASKTDEKAYTVTTGNFVTLDSGTGLVHMAPFGEDDMAVLKSLEIEVVHPIDAEGKFNEEVSDFTGMTVFKANSEIIKKLKAENKVVKHESCNHSYPFCWRCDTPLIYRPISTWFVKVESMREDLLKNNQEINWTPEHIKEGRFGKWLDGARDWAISRNRYWGAPLPIWRNIDDPEDLIVIGSIEELEKYSGVKVNDLHKHKVDPIEIKKDGKTYKRIEEVLDCWFESGSMPYAQLHYPFENKEKFESTFPAQFIAEGLDQTRGWFYTLHVLANSLFEKPAFKNIIVNGIVLAEDGQKMSKRLQNYPDPNHVLEEYGADALRFYLMNSPVVKADDMRFSEKGVADVVRNMILPVWNAYSFLVTYANIDKWEADHSSLTADRLTNKLDQWILTELNSLIKLQIENMESYDLQKASNSIYQFVDNLTNWYIRRSRRRFWKSEDDGDKQNAYQTLHTVLTKLCQVMAPFMPFLSEEIYRNLTGEESVHLTEYPTPENTSNEALQQEIFMTKTVVSLGLAARAKAKIRVRQPLRKVQIAMAQQYDANLINRQLETIKEELNVKEVELIKEASNLATVIAKPNARMIAQNYPELRPHMQEVIKIANQGAFEIIDGKVHVDLFLKLEKDGKIIEHNGFKFEMDEVKIDYIGKEGFDVKTEAGILVAIDTNITDELKQEGVARDLVRQIQELRKAANYKVDDRISIALINVDESITEKFGDYIKNETLADSIETDIMEPDQFSDFEGMIVKVKK